MKIDVEQILLDFHGNPMETKYGEETVLLTLRVTCINALLGVKYDRNGMPEEYIPGVKRLEYNELAQKIRDAEREVDLSAKQIQELEGRIEKVYPSNLVYVAAYKMLEGKKPDPPAPE